MLIFATGQVQKSMFAAKKQETVLEAQTRALNVPRYRFFATCHVRLRNGMEPPKT